MGNCTITKFNGVLNDDTLPVFNHIVIHAKKLSNLNHNSEFRMRLVGNGITVTVTGEGYFSDNYSGLEPATPHLTTYTIPDSNVHWFYFKNDNYDIHITGKYGGLDTFKVQPSSASRNSLFNADLSEFKYDDSLTAIDIGRHITGNASDVAKQGVVTVSLMFGNLTASLSDFNGCLSIQELDLPSKANKDEILDFVSSQVNSGRTDCSDLRLYNLKNFAVLSGVSLDYSASDDAHISWDTASKVIAYLGASTIENCPKIYAYGATAEEIATWEQAGKTVVIVN